MIQFLIAISIVAFALFIIYASERFIFHRNSAAAAEHTAWAAGSEGTVGVVVALLLAVISSKAVRIVARKVIACLTLVIPVRNRPWVETMMRRAWLG